MPQRNWTATARLLLFCLLWCMACQPPETTTDSFVVNARLAGEPDKLHPLLSLNAYAAQVEELLFLPLQQFDPVTLTLQPVVAQATPGIVPIQAGPFQGGVAYTFQIREEATWDNGQPVVADDYVFTLKAMLNPEVATPHYRSYFDFLGDVQIDPVNPKVFTVKVKKTYMLAEAALSSLPIYPKYLYDPNGWLDQFSIPGLQEGQLDEAKMQLLGQFAEAFESHRHFATPEGIGGCGPYSLVSWETGRRITLQKKANWWGATLAHTYPLLAAHPTEIQYKIIPDNAAAITALKTGQLDVAAEIKPLSFTELKSSDFINQQFNLYTPPYLSYYYIGINGNKPALSNQPTRRALAHLMDTQQAIESLLFGMGERVVGPIHPSKSFYNKNLQPIEFNIDKARQLLQQDGWADTDRDGILDKTLPSGKQILQLEFLYSASNELGEGVGLLLKEAAAKAGIAIELKGMDFKNAVTAYRARDYDLAFFAWSKLPGPDDLKQIWHTSSDTPTGGNRTGFGDQQSDALIDAIRVTLDENKRNDLYLRIQERIYDDQPYIFLFAPLERIAINKRFSATTSARRPGFFIRQFTLNDMPVNN